MKRFVLSMPDDLFLALQRRAKERGISMAAVVREAAEREVQPQQPWPKGVGKYRSGYSDTSVLASEGRVPPRE